MVTFNNAFDSSLKIWNGTDFVGIFSGENTFLTGLKRQKGNKFWCDSLVSHVKMAILDFDALLSHNYSRNKSHSKAKKGFLDEKNLVTRPGPKAEKQNTVAENTVNTLG